MGGKKIEPQWSLLWEVCKEPLRFLLLAVIAWALTVLGSVDEKWVPVVTLVLRFIDAKMHEIGKENDNDLLKRGITQF